ncbi:hypothetical protein GE21DRAFT_1281317 [Neurospora crassa]|nr:hypothetical protein GE21DRAFT_1281317 [Neurospora crassa]
MFARMPHLDKQTAHGRRWLASVWRWRYLTRHFLNFNIVVTATAFSLFGLCQSAIGAIGATRIRVGPQLLAG